jgi:peptide/nickel transport system substrate-binding protein
MTLVLKSGVSFADGSILDASLVKANLDRRTDSSLVAFSTIKPGGDDEIASVDVVSPNTVALKFTAPHANFEGELDGTAGMMIGKSAIADLSTLSKAPDGSGPYTLDTGATVVGSSYSMIKNDKSDVSAAFPFKTIVFKPILDPQARVNALVSGQVDTAPINSTSSDLARSKGLSIASTGGTIMTMITFDKLGTIVPAFGSEKVRQAIQMAIDRKGLVEALHKGDEPTWNALPISSPGFDKSLEEKFAYNPDKAKSLLKEAGYGDGFSFDIVIQPETQTDLQAVQKDLAAVGVTMNIKVASSTQEGFDATSTTALGIAPITWASPSGNMSDIFFGFANSQGATDAQLTAAVSAIEEGGSKATEPLKQLNDRLIEAGWDIPLYELVSQPQGYNPAKLKNVADQNGLLSKFLPAT